MDKYEEALERAKELHEAGNALTKAQMEIVFPELKESEDERIRKWLIEMVEELRKANPTNAEHNENCSEAIAYLERQKEPLTPEEKMNHPLYLEGFDVGKKVGEVLKEKHPAEWSEEDELMRTAVIQTLERFGGRGTTGMQIDWLKSLRPQPHWKPSEEQISALEYFIRAWGESGSMSPQNPVLCAAKSLLTDLQKLL